MSNDVLVFLRDFSTMLELTSAIAASFFFYKYKNSLLKFFLLYLWITTFVEFFGYFIRDYLLIKNNNWLFNLYSILSFFYLLSLYKNTIKDYKRKTAITIAMASYTVSIIIFGFVENYFVEALVIPYIIGSCLIIISIILYFVEILTTEKVLYVKKNLLFWISIGLLLFHAGGIPFNITVNYYALIGSFNYLFIINYILIIILNISFIIGFICSDRKQLY